MTSEDICINYLRKKTEVVTTIYLAHRNGALKSKIGEGGRPKTRRKDVIERTAGVQLQRQTKGNNRCVWKLFEEETKLVSNNGCEIVENYENCRKGTKVFEAK